MARSRKPPSSPAPLDPRKLFEEAVAGARPLGGTAERVPPPRADRPTPVSPNPGRRPIEAPEGSPAPPPGDAGLAKKLKRGEYPVEARIDLHRMRAAEARAAVIAAATRARSQRKRCLLVIHGQGRHSEADPVLRGALLGWLREPPLSDLVLAQSEARPADGGAGAHYLLLRK